MKHFKLLIIGAGASGIASATKLLENGFNDFRILEAENRIGGRINTTFLGDIPIELGAEWIHGEANNIVYEIASEHDLADNSSNFSFINTKFFESSGYQVSKEISVPLCEFYSDVFHIDCKEVDSEALEGSLGTYFDLEFQKGVDILRKKVDIKDDLCKKFVKTFENFENSINGCHSWYEASLKGHLEYWECHGNSLTHWKNNRYDTIFKLLTKKIPDEKKQLPIDDKIIFNKEVTKIKWMKECVPDMPDVEVLCSDGTIYYADHVLITCSLGVLKDTASEMFSPALPEEKLKCIENLGFGTVDKIFLKFSHQWWENDLDGFAFLWSEEERKNDSSGWLSGVICFHPVNSESPVLRGWVTAEAAQLMETLPEREIEEGINFLLNKFLGSSFSVPSVEVCLMSKWYSNPHFRGSYSCRLMKSELSDVWASQLAEPVCNAKGDLVLLFGGEASHDHYFSAVHGAIEAGYREANRLLPIIMKENIRQNNYLVTIVGAGISGLAAAKTLYENGISDVIVLEAQSKPGGRIRTLQVGDCYLELGAQWIHGDKNEVFAICRKNDLVTDEYSSEGEGYYLRPNGDRVDDRIVKEVDDTIKDILENCETYISSKSQDISRSIGEELLLKYNQYLENCRQDTAEIKEIKKDLFDWHIRYQLIDNSCSDLYNLSAKLWGLFKFCGGNDYVNFKNGFSSFVDTLVNSLPKNMIRYETAVKEIEWAEEIYLNGRSGFHKHCSERNYNAKITCNDGFTFFSHYVIVTSSLGYLKKNHTKMFSPSLPKHIAEAIEFLDFGVVDKIFLIYKKPWWDSEVKGFQLVWSEKESRERQVHWGRYLTGFDVVIKNKPILLGWVGGDGAKMVEKLPENQLAREATELLRQFTRNSNIPLPEKVVRSEWWSNEYVRGGYSHITVKCDERGISGSNLAQPVYTTIHKGETFSTSPTLLFAGESAHKSHFSTVHGAFESGLSQAKLILEHIQNQNN